MRWLMAILLATALLDLPAHAQERQGPPSERRFNPDGPRPPYGPPWGRDWRMRRGPTDDEWSETAQFMRENSPRRWEAMNKLPPGHQDRLKPLAFQRYRLLKLARENEPELYDLHLKRWRLEDEIFGLTRDLRRGDPARESDVRQQLRARFGQMIDLRNKERHIRIARLQQQIDAEKALITEETANREQIITKRIELAETEPGHLGDEDPEAATQESEASAAPESRGN